MAPAVVFPKCSMSSVFVCYSFHYQCIQHPKWLQHSSISTYTFSLNSPFTLESVHPVVTSFFLGGRTALKSPHFIRVVHTTGTHSPIGLSFLTANNSRMAVLQTLVTEKQPQLTFGSRRANTWQNNRCLNSPYVAVLHRKTTASQPYVHHGPHLRLP